MDTKMITSMHIAADFSVAELHFMEEAVKFAGSNPECFSQWVTDEDDADGLSFTREVCSTLASKLECIDRVRNECDTVFTVERTDKGTVYGEENLGLDGCDFDELIYCVPFRHMADCKTRQHAKEFILQALLEDNTLCGVPYTSICTDAAVMAEICEDASHDCDLPEVDEETKQLFFDVTDHVLIETMPTDKMLIVLEAMQTYTKFMSAHIDRFDMIDVIKAAMLMVKNLF